MLALTHEWLWTDTLGATAAFFSVALLRLQLVFALSLATHANRMCCDPECVKGSRVSRVHAN